MNAAFAYLATLPGLEQALWGAVLLVAGLLGGAVLESEILTHQFRRHLRGTVHAAKAVGFAEGWDEAWAVRDRCEAVVAAVEGARQTRREREAPTAWRH